MSNNQYQWFFKTDDQAKLLFPVQELNNDRNNWSYIILSAYGNSDQVFFPQVVQDPKLLYLCTKDDVESRIATLIEHDETASLQSKAASKLHLATSVLKTHKTDRRSAMSRRVGAGLQDVLCTMGDFLQSFSGIAEIMKGADQQYGGLAYGTISLLLSVAVHKQEREEAIEEAMEELAYAFPRLETLQRLKPSETLRALVVSVFELVIVFCRETTEYYARRSRRLAAAFSPKELKMRTMSQLRSKLLEIRKESEVILLGEIAEMRKQLRQIEMTAVDTNHRVRHAEGWINSAQSRADRASLAELQKVLGLKQLPTGGFAKTNLSRLQYVLDEEFSSHRRNRHSAQQLTWDALEAEPTFSKWWNQDESAILLLGGGNWSDDSQIQLNWLSQASILCVQELRMRSPTTCVACFLSQTDFTSTKSTRSTFADVACYLIYQLASQHPDLLQTQRAEIAQAVCSDAWKAASYREAIPAMFRLLTSLAASFSEIALVIDRIESCSWNAEEDIEALDTVVWSFLDLVRDPSLAHVRIKILLIMEDTSAQSTARILKRERGACIDWKTDWDQEAAED